MTEIKKFSRGHRTYTRVGSFKEVRLEGGPSPKTPPVPSQAPVSPPVQLDVDPRTEMGVYSNVAFVHRSPDEIVLDFSFLTAQTPRGRILSRIILSPKHARQLAALLKEAADGKE